MKRSRRPISARSAANKPCEILTRFGKKHTMAVGRKAGGHFFRKKRKSEESDYGIPCSRAERSARRLCSIHHGLRRGGRDDDHSAVLFHHGGRAVGLDLHLPRADGHAGVEAAQKHRPQAHPAAHAALILLL